MRRKLQLDKVQLAEQVQYERVKMAQQVVKERVEKDVEFARDVLKAVGENLPKEIKEACEKTISNGPKSEEASGTVEEAKNRIVTQVQEDVKKFTLPKDLKEQILEAKNARPDIGT